MVEAFHLENGEEAKHHPSESRDLQEEVEDAAVEMIGVTEAEAEADGSPAVCEE